MMTPIHKIPFEVDTPPLHALVHGEIDGRATRSVAELMTELVEHSGSNSEHIGITLDWAMQIRTEMGISWAECIDAAMILYFG